MGLSNLEMDGSAKSGDVVEMGGAEQSGDGLGLSNQEMGWGYGWG